MHTLDKRDGTGHRCVMRLPHHVVSNVQHITQAAIKQMDVVKRCI